MKRLKFLLLSAFISLFVSNFCFGQILISNSTPLTESFSIGTSTTASLPSNWKMSPAGTGSPTWSAGGNFTAVNLGSSSGSPNTGGRYNWGNATTTTDRAIGFMTSSGYASPNSIMAWYQNSNATAISQLTVSFNVERYRINTAAASIQFYYSLDGSTWVAVTAGDINTITTGTSAYGFPLNTYNVTAFNITGLNIPNGSSIYLRWNFNTTGSNSQGLGLDDVSVIAAFENPPPIAPVATDATNITSNSFSANWNAVADATSYRLDVYTGLTTQLINEGFDNVGTNGTPVPTGWTFTGIGGTYTTSSNYGVSPPSLQMDATGDRIETATFSNPAQLSFWIKGQSTNTVSALLVEEFYSTSWNTIANISNLPTSGTTKTYSLNSLTTKVRFTYTKSTGNLAFDDVVITGTTVNTFVSGYQDKTINAPSISDAVTGLSSNTTYYYRVRAVNSYGTSSNSNVITVTTTIPSLIYTWNATGTGDWTTASNWTPERNTPGLGDKLVFNNGQTLTVTNIPAQTISQIEVSGNTIVNLQAGTAGNTLTLQGGTGVDLNVSIGSQLNFTGTNSLLMPLQTGVTGSISGNIFFTNADHRLSASDVSAITFNSGSIFTAGSGFSGNVFGSTGTNGSVVFSNGATYIQIGGASPFGDGTLVNIVTFQTGSLYKHQSSVLPSLTNRVYANFEYDYNGIVTNTISGSSAWTFDNLIISQGTFNANVALPVNCKGNITVANGSTFGFNPASASDFSFNGSSSQIISGTGTLTFGDKVNLKINNASGVVLQKELTVNGGLTFVNGILNTGSNSVLFSSTATNPVELSTSYIFGNAVMQTKDLGAGGLTEFLGLEIGAGSGSITGLTFTRNTGMAKNFGTNQSIMCSWNISGSITAARPLTFKWFSDFDNGKVFSNVNKAQMWKSGDNGATWTTIGDPVNVYGQNPRIVSGIAATSFSIWTVSDNNAPLPVTLASFNSSIIGRNIKLNWTTTSEINNSGFNIERMNVADNNWSRITFVSGHGTVNAPTNYSFEDRNLQTGKYKYRLKQIDVNGNFEYFALNGEVEIGVPKTFNLSQNYPNPFNPVTKINFDLPTECKVTMMVYDITGREIARLLNSEYKKAGYYTTDFNAGMLSSGVYFYSLSADNFRMTKKMVVLK